ncbi:MULTISPECIES: cellulase family glycosylhydrolase [unclassified Mucilaginibacter]|uniref:glycoside hydrolase family 5 protein n=1 Tax=unclassified Mucilaginibacter TaxID=2617802 RepID=UPI002AC9AD8B|nr:MULTISPECIES: cellulase family glycosylhydrolase [unclassified Mucilaginibacter]MEB0260415.1 cellulase family glycosylhydrolase [Mucilaginibacter sp. 10I4]MEB0279995.1 cellulase family glycosylhydrolase [Mucilaginibacter sp. 10B2]MEB0302704.1 cellulase family glycosylhydrolase [Mucilaginibacter sp. 5C4]WPX23663.1 cellulase family glycosylhydrolase [Mucilaginibacter sp. 5C4]
MQFDITKSNPIFLTERQIAFNRAKSVGPGVSVSWLEQTWNKDVLSINPIKNADFELIRQLGFKSIRLPVAFAYFQSQNIPVEKVFTHIDEVLKQCKAHRLKLIIDYHYGNLNDTNYLTETPKLINLWLILTNRYMRESPEIVFFELYNEPPHMNPKVWKDASYNIVTAIRKVDKKRTLIVGASNFNSIYELSRMERLADENIIYTFHFYEPFFFTHQGADWVGDQMATTGVPFPYNVKTYPPLNPKVVGTWGEHNYYQYCTDGNEQSVHDKLLIVKNWGAKYGVPILCGEYGVYNKYADADSRCRYIKVVRKNLKAMGIPGIMWDYNTNFSIFNGPPAINNLSNCMKQAIDYTGAK